MSIYKGCRRFDTEMRQLKYREQFEKTLEPQGQL